MRDHSVQYSRVLLVEVAGRRLERAAQALVRPEEEVERALEDKGHGFGDVGDRGVGREAQRELGRHEAQVVAPARDADFAAAVLAARADDDPNPRRAA